MVYDEKIMNSENHILIAMPRLEDPLFAKTVVYMCDHTKKGAMGMIVNRPLDVKLGDLLDQLSINPSADCNTDIALYFGGPVLPQCGFVLHRGMPWDHSIEVDHDFHVTTSQDILHAIAANEGPEQFLIALGYSGWDPGQLENEMKENIWLNAPVAQSLLFDVAPEKRWETSVQTFGIELAQLSGIAGHA